jgi:hypothetical protein
MYLKDLINCVNKRKINDEKNIYLLKNEKFRLFMLISIIDNSLQFSMYDCCSTNATVLDLIAHDKYSLYEWHGYTLWLEDFKKKLPNMCTYLAYLYIFNMVKK